MKNNIPRIMIAGVGSGSGKTTITCGLLNIFKKMNMKTAAFKCGPDYIDAMFHKKIIGVKANNLDIFMVGENNVKYLLDMNSVGYEISVIEGVMGFYDGLCDNSGFSSSNHLSLITNTPVILVVDCKGMGLSVTAVIKGFKEFRKNNINGILLNNISKTAYYMYKSVIEEEIGIKVVGYLPKMKDINLKSRHLGLIKPDEIKNINNIIDSISEKMIETLDIEMILNISKNTKEFYFSNIEIKKAYINKKISIAYDNAFCFYYDDNIKLFEIIGAEIEYFSPLKDKQIPKNTDIIIFGGGYPELYAKELYENKSMRNSVINMINSGTRCFAECGGFMYLHKKMCDYDMVGKISGHSEMTKNLDRFGYITLVSKKNNMLCKKGDSINAHEFHYSQSSSYGSDFEAIKSNGKKWDCIHTNENLFAGYPHINFWGNVDFAFNLLDF